MSINNNLNSNNKTTSTTSTILPSPVYTHSYHHPYSSLYQPHISAATTSLLLCSATGIAQANAPGNHTSDNISEITTGTTTGENTTNTSNTSDTAVKETATDAKEVADLNYSFVKREINTASGNNPPAQGD